MTDAYLRSLGFAATDQTRGAGQPLFSHAWRYQHEYQAVDGAQLFVEHPLGIANCRLSTLPAPFDAQDIFATTSLHDRPALEAAIESFFTAHGAKAASIPW
ncbi:hypothetical protein [Hymenobacter sp. AT01-02]|uniref:hypothetical protein n=1 Tax=Hymenobacter sp. AT01-02 TaxID=1571877 RepID=UPI0005F2557E|nr:hypothetical protein [Hymenobacter sp. AT01-02]